MGVAVSELSNMGAVAGLQAVWHAGPILSNIGS